MKMDFAVPEDKVLLGVIIKAHGIRGDVVVYCFSGEPKSLTHYDTFFLIDKNGRISSPLAVRLCRKVSNNALVGFQGITSKEQTAELLHAGLLVDKKELPQLGENEFYWHQYEGKKIVDKKGLVFGRIEELFDNGAQIILVVRSDDGKEFFIPAIDNIIVQETEDTVVIAPPPGLLGINEKYNDDI